VHEIPADFTVLPDPHVLMRTIARDGPVQPVLLRGQKIWLVTGYDEVLAGLSSHDLSNDPRLAGGGPPAGQSDRNLLYESLLVTDPPEHTRLRKSVAGIFTTRRIERLRPRIEHITDTLLDHIAPRGHADLMADFAIPLPISVICELLGIPDSDRDAFRRWSIALVMPPADPDTLALAAVAQAELADYFAHLITKKRAEPCDDLLTALACASGDDQLSDRELQAMAILLVLAGHETTANLIGTGTLTLLRDPAQLAAIRADPALLPGAVEELARYAGPISLGVARFTRREIELGGKRIPAGEMIMFAMAAASRDPSRFDHPDALDVGHAPRPHLAFGYGAHYCLGAALARVEANIALGGLARRLPELSLAIPPAALTWRRASTRGLTKLPVTFTPQPPLGTAADRC
jgi:cytochrome P450